jgi:hypothetical protein
VVVSPAATGLRGERSGLRDRVFCENFLGSLEGLVDRRFRCHPVLHSVEFGDAEHMLGIDLLAGF